MAWELESRKHLIEAKAAYKDGGEYVSASAYTPGTYSSEVNIIILKEHKNVLVTPFVLDTYNLLINFEQNNGVVNELLVGVRDDQSVEYYGFKWTPEDGVKRVIQYFFKDDQPGYYRGSNIEGPWPSNRDAVIDPYERALLGVLQDEHPSFRDSLENCMAILEVPGPTFQRVPMPKK